MGKDVYLWLGLLILFIVVEAATIGLTSIWFAAGSLAAVFAAAARLSMLWQVIVFLAVSIILLIFTRPWVKKYVNAKHEKTNYEKRVGEIVRVTEKVDNMAQTGAVLAGGLTWTARAADDNEVFEPGMLAKVLSVKGVKLIITKYEEDKK